MYRIFYLTLIIIIISYSNSASITTYSSSTELISNSSYRYFFLRQYYIDLLNKSHSSLIQSMIKTHRLTPKLEQIQNRRRRQISLSPVSTILPTNCSQIHNNQIQTTFRLFSLSIESLSSIELIYHIDSKLTSLPIEIAFEHSNIIKTNFEYNSNRDYYSIDLYNYFLRLNNRNLVLQIILSNQTCQNSRGYIVLSSKRVSSNDSPQSIASKCRVKTLDINFEELGLADLIIRPKEYTFTYCDGSCENLHQQQQFSFRTFLQSILSQKHSNIPQLNCHPSEYSNDNFLLRQLDGNMEIYRIKNAIVKQCACL